jgi:hypothetical protein
VIKKMDHESRELKQAVSIIDVSKSGKNNMIFEDKNRNTQRVKERDYRD